MIIVYGTRCYGKADVIEGVGHVTQRFVHIMFVPLIPIQTLFLVDSDRGIKLPFSFKAALSGWLRAGAILTGLGMIAAAIGNFGDDEPLLGIVCGVIGLLSFGAFPLLGLLFGRCSPQRKAEIMGMMGMPTHDMHAHAPQPQWQPPAPAPAYPQYGGPSPYGTPQQGGYGAPPAPQPSYGAPPPHGGGYGAPPPPAGGFGQPAGYGAPPPMGYGPPQPQQPAYAAPPMQGYGPQAWDPNRRY